MKQSETLSSQTVKEARAGSFELEVGLGVYNYRLSCHHRTPKRGERWGTMGSGSVRLQ